MPTENTDDLFDYKYGEEVSILYDKIEKKCLTCSDILLKKDNLTKIEFFYFIKSIITPKSIYKETFKK